MAEKVFSSMTYQDYLDNWDGHFGERTDAEYWYWRHGTQVPYTAYRLTEEQFNEHLKGLNEAQAKFDAALKAENDDAMGAALAESFPHELVLLV